MSIQIHAVSLKTLLPVCTGPRIYKYLDLYEQTASAKQLLFTGFRVCKYTEMNSSYLRCLKGCSVGLSDDLINTDCLFNKSKFDLEVSKASSSPAHGASRII